MMFWLYITLTCISFSLCFIDPLFNFLDPGIAASDLSDHTNPRKRIANEADAGASERPLWSLAQRHLAEALEESSTQAEENTAQTKEREQAEANHTHSWRYCIKD